MNWSHSNQEMRLGQLWITSMHDVRRDSLVFQHFLVIKQHVSERNHSLAENLLQVNVTRLPFTVQNVLQRCGRYHVIVTLYPNIFVMTNECGEMAFIDRSNMIDNCIQTVHVIAQWIIHFRHKRFHVQFKWKRNERGDFLVDLAGMFESL